MPPLLLCIQLDDGTTQSHSLPAGTYVIGREPGCDVIVNSQGVSRRHARLTVAETSVEIEDLNSTSGTFLSGAQLSGRTQLQTPASLHLGHLPFTLSPSSPEPTSSSTSQKGNYEIGYSLNVKPAPGHFFAGGFAAQSQQRLEMLYELPLQFAAESNLRRLYRLILDRLMALIPGAVRGAILLKESDSGKLALRASVPENLPPISRSLILRAITERQGFIWEEKPCELQDMSASMIAIGIRTGMYAPLIWKDDVIGLLFVDNPSTPKAFSREDLQFLLSVANYAAAAVANQLLQSTIEHNNRTLEHLLTNFSPKVRNRLLEKSRAGSLQPGGEKSTVTVLLSDLRGFTKTSSSMDSALVVEMLNDYFQILGPEIFRHDGTIDKFIGDAILAVFGSPEPDEDHAAKALKAAVQMQHRMEAVNARRKAEGLAFCELGIGVYTGEVLHGFIGATDHLQYTVIGDTVNMASRYCDGAGAGEIILGPTTLHSLAHPPDVIPCFIKTKHEGDLPAFRAPWKIAH